DLGYAAQHGDLLTAPWPVVDEAALEQDEIELVLQVNGKLRAHARAEIRRARRARAACPRQRRGDALHERPGGEESRRSARAARQCGRLSVPRAPPSPARSPRSSRPAAFICAARNRCLSRRSTFQATTRS